MRSLVFGKRWRKAGDGASGKNETDCSGKRRILRKRVKRISEKAEAYCLEKRIILRKRERRISGDGEADCLWGRKNLQKRERRISEDEEVDCLEKRNGVTWERVHSGSENAARCICWRSALRQPSHRTAFLASPFSFFSQGTIAFSVKRLSPPLPARRTPSGGAVKRKPPLAPSLCGKFKRGLCFILSLYIHPLPFPKGKERAGAGIQLEGVCMRNVRLSGENSTPGHAKKRAMVPSAANWRGDPMLSPWQSISQSLSPS